MKNFILKILYIFPPMTLVKFLVAGVSVVLVNIFFLYLFTSIFGLWYLLSSAIAFTISTCMSFVVHKWWTFMDASTDAIKRQVSMHLSLATADILANILLMYVLTDLFGIWYILSQIISSGLIAAGNFLVYRFHIFRT